MPKYDLEALWEEHCRYEFETRDADAIMATMVDEPYVNDIPTMTGGVGHDQLKRFYKYHFIDANPPDTKLVPVSHTVGTDRLVDEMLFSFTHTSEIDWMLPGVPPTGRKVEVPVVAVVQFRDGKLAHEHIYWDQASTPLREGRRPGFKAAVPVAVSSAAVPGSTFLSSSARPPATGTSPTTGTTMSASVWRGRLPLNSLPLYL